MTHEKNEVWPACMTLLAAAACCRTSPLANVVPSTIRTRDRGEISSAKWMRSSSLSTDITEILKMSSVSTSTPWLLGGYGAASAPFNPRNKTARSRRFAILWVGDTARDCGHWVGLQVFHCPVFRLDKDSWLHLKVKKAMFAQSV